MRQILHILTEEQRSFAGELIQHQATIPDCLVETFDLKQPNPDYAALLEKIFSAESVEVW